MKEFTTSNMNELFKEIYGDKLSDIFKGIPRSPPKKSPILHPIILGKEHDCVFIDEKIEKKIDLGWGNWDNK